MRWLFIPGGIVVLLRLALYMVAIGGIFWVKRKYGRK